MSEHFKPAIVLLAILTLLTGGFYPASVTILAQVLFPKQANGSLMASGQGKTVGSELIGQSFSDPKYFWGRPSATAPYPYNAAASSGSNLGPTNPALIDSIRARIAALRAVDPANQATIPVDLVTASGSGLDPHISPSAAEYQIMRVAKARRIDAEKVRKLVDAHVESRQLGLLGEPRINVLQLNLALDGIR